MDLPARTAGSLLVVLQFGLMAALALLVLLEGRLPPLAALLLLAGLGLGGWAMTSHPGGRFNIHPAPREGGCLVEQGPYRHIRHPMYSAVLLCGAGCAWAAATPLALVALGVLALVLVAKAELEERWLLQAHPGYADYRRRTRRFVPGLL